jgi:hypothetical protein
MTAECYFCHGLVLSAERGGIVLDSHGDHEVYLHERCAVGQNAVEATAESTERVDVTCPECGAVETTRLWGSPAARGDAGE